RLLRVIPPKQKHTTLTFVHSTAIINALSASSDGQQQTSTPLFGFGASSSMSMSNGQPVIGAPVNKLISVIAAVPVKKSVSALFLTTTEGKKIWVFVGFGRGSGRANASVLIKRYPVHLPTV